MSDKTAIEWTDSTWNPIRARNRETGGLGHFCVHASPGCKHCYSEGFQPRFKNPVRFAAQDLEKVELFLDEKVLLQPLRWKRPRRIFACSMTDLFADFVPDEWIDKVFAVMARCPQHTFQVLTKRSRRMREWFERYDPSHDDNCADMVAKVVNLIAWPSALRAANQRLQAWPLPNVWSGVSVEDQTRADERVPDLLATPAAMRFLSCEPLLGPVNLFGCSEDRKDIWNWLSGETATMYFDGPDFEYGPKLDWIIVGGESGPRARPLHPDWARALRDQSQAAGVAFFFKQWGEWEPRDVWTGHQGGGRFETQVAIMPDGSECPHDVTPQDVGAHRMAWVGKKRAGRLLDGRTHDEFPA